MVETSLRLLARLKCIYRNPILQYILRNLLPKNHGIWLPKVTTFLQKNTLRCSSFRSTCNSSLQKLFQVSFSVLKGSIEQFHYPPFSLILGAGTKAEMPHGLDVNQTTQLQQRLIVQFFSFFVLAQKNAKSQTKKVAEKDSSSKLSLRKTNWLQQCQKKKKKPTSQFQQTKQ